MTLDANSTRSVPAGAPLIDGSGKRKRGKAIDVVGYIKEAGSSVFVAGHRYLKVALRFRRVILPWTIDIYIPKEFFKTPEGKDLARRTGRSFHTLNEMAAEILARMPDEWSCFFTVYVLMDSGFCNPTVCSAVRNKGFHFLCAAQSTRNFWVDRGRRKTKKVRVGTNTPGHSALPGPRCATGAQTTRWKETTVSIGDANRGDEWHRPGSMCLQQEEERQTCGRVRLHQVGKRTGHDSHESFLRTLARNAEAPLSADAVGTCNAQCRRPRRPTRGIEPYDQPHRCPPRVRHRVVWVVFTFPARAGQRRPGTPTLPGTVARTGLLIHCMIVPEGNLPDSHAAGVRDAHAALADSPGAGRAIRKTGIATGHRIAVARGGGIGDSLGPKGVQVDFVVSPQLQVFQAGSAGQQVVGHVQNMLRLMVRQVDLQHVQPAVNGLGQTRSPGQQVHAPIPPGPRPRTRSASS